MHQDRGEQEAAGLGIQGRDDCFFSDFVGSGTSGKNITLGVAKRLREGTMEIKMTLDSNANPPCPRYVTLMVAETL